VHRAGHQRRSAALPQGIDFCPNSSPRWAETKEQGLADETKKASDLVLSPERCPGKRKMNLKRFDLSLTFVLAGRYLRSSFAKRS
jgi:hypothetical protein